MARQMLIGLEYISLELKKKRTAKFDELYYNSQSELRCDPIPNGTAAVACRFIGLGIPI